MLVATILLKNYLINKIYNKGIYQKYTMLNQEK